MKFSIFKHQFYPLKLKKTLPVKRIVIILIFFAVAAGILNTFDQQLKNYFYFLTSPLMKVSIKSGNYLSGLFSSVFKSENVKKENDALREKNRKLLSEIAVLRDMARQQQAAGEALENAVLSKFKLALAQTVGLDASNDTILIDKGTEDEISEGMPVVSAQGVLFGRISQSWSNFSQVELISGKKSILNVQIEPKEVLSNDEVAYGIVRGKGNLSAYLDLLPAEIEVKRGDVLVTSALGGVFPKNLLIGEIISADKNDLKPFQTAGIRLFLSVGDIENLLVVKNYLK